MLNKSGTRFGLTDYVMPHLPFIEQFIHIPEIDTALYRVAGLQINKIVVLFIKSLWFH